MESYMVLIGDMIHSKQLKNRAAVQKSFISLMTKLNNRYAECIISSFKITQGDEFQGLLKDGSDIVEIVDYILSEMQMVQLRFGVGIGEVDTKIDAKNTALIDGPCYHRAREAIRKVEESEKKYSSALTNMMVITNHAKYDSLINSLLLMCYTVRQSWSKRQNEIYHLYQNNKLSQTEIAERLGINQSSVNRSLKHAHYYAYRVAVESINDALQERG